METLSITTGSVPRSRSELIKGGNRHILEDEAAVVKAAWRHTAVTGSCCNIVPAAILSRAAGEAISDAV